MHACSPCRRRLEVVGTRKKGAGKGRHTIRGEVAPLSLRVSLLWACSFFNPNTSKHLLRRLACRRVISPA